MRLPGLDHLTLPVADLARAKEFYITILGFQLLWEQTDLAVLRGGGRLDLALRLAPHQARMPREFHFGFKVDSVNEVCAWEDTLRRRGADINHIEGNQFCRSVYFLDPDGHCIEIYYPGPDAR